VVGQFGQVERLVVAFLKGVNVFPHLSASALDEQDDAAHQLRLLPGAPESRFSLGNWRIALGDDATSRVEQPLIALGPDDEAIHAGHPCDGVGFLRRDGDRVGGVVGIDVLEVVPVINGRSPDGLRLGRGSRKGQSLLVERDRGRVSTAGAPCPLSPAGRGRAGVGLADDGDGALSG